jgi:hypothetical protein
MKPYALEPRPISISKRCTQTNIMRVNNCYLNVKQINKMLVISELAAARRITIAVTNIKKTKNNEQFLGALTVLKTNNYMSQNRELYHQSRVRPYTTN